MRQFNRKSDTIFWYSKGNVWTFNKDSVRMPYKDGSPHSGGFVENDGTRLKSNEYTKGKVPENWWTDIAVVARSKYERTGYPTQKPLALLKRIVLASSNEGDIIMDPFCGCATTCVAAQQLGRKWIGIDIEKQAVKILIERLSDDAGLFKDFTASQPSICFIRNTIYLRRNINMDMVINMAMNCWKKMGDSTKKRYAEIFEMILNHWEPKESPMIH
jgi:hypothetical protein